MKVENSKIMQSMCQIHQGQEDLNVASHKIKRKDMQMKSLNFVRQKQLAVATDMNNDKILRSIQEAKTGVPNKESLQKDWDQKMKYKRNIQQKKYC